MVGLIFYPEFMLKIKPIVNAKMNTYHLLSNFIFSNNKEDNETSLDNLIEEAIQENNYSFFDGLLGVGWLISYLTKNDMLEADVDEILYEVDDHIYKMTINAVVKNQLDLDYLLQLISYCHQRLLNVINPKNIYRRFALIESLKLLIDKACILTENHYSSLPVEKAKFLLKLSYLINTSFFEKDIEVFFYKNIEYLIGHYQKKLPNSFQYEDQNALCYLLLTSKQYSNPYWVQQIVNIINLVDYSEANLNVLRNVADSYNPLIQNSILVDLPHSHKEDSLIFLLASNLKSITFHKFNVS